MKKLFNIFEIKIPLFIFIIVLIYTILGIIFKPVVANDILNGLVSQHNFNVNGKWNTLYYLSEDSNIKPLFLTWWSPGQCEIPVLFSNLLELKFGLVVPIILGISLLIGFYFYHKLFILLGISDRISKITLLVICFQRFINISFFQFSSADIFLFPIVPFFSITLINMNMGKIETKIPFLKFIIILCFLSLMLFIKNSAIIYIFGLNLFFFCNFVKENFFLVNRTRFLTFLSNLFKSTFFLLSTCTLLILYFYFFEFLNKGIGNPSVGHSPNFSLLNILNGLIPPQINIFLGGISLGSFLANIPNSNSSFFDVMNNWNYYGLIIGFVILTVFVYNMWFYRKYLFEWIPENNIFGPFVFSIMIPYIIAWFIFSIKDSNVSTEDRLFFPISILFLPIIIKLSKIMKIKVLRFILIISILFSCFYGLFTIPYRIYKYNIKGSSDTNNEFFRGFRVYSFENHSDLELFNRIKKYNKTSFKYLVVPNAEIGFKIPTVLTFVTPVPMETNDLAINKYLCSNNNDTIKSKVLILSYKNIIKNDTYKHSCIDSSDNFFLFNK